MKDDLWDLAVKAIRLAMPGIQQTIEQTAYNILKDDRDEKKNLQKENERLLEKNRILMKFAYEQQSEAHCKYRQTSCVLCGADLYAYPPQEHAPSCPFARE